MKRNKLADAISTWFGCGYFPVGPGTVGSLAALVIAYELVDYAHWPPLSFAWLAAAAAGPAMWAAGVTARTGGSHDPGHVVVDEVVGQWLTLSGAAVWNWKSCLAAFVLFRLFDIWKPWPIRRLEALPGGVGIVADDLGAGAAAALVLFGAGCFNLY